MKRTFNVTLTMEAVVTIEDDVLQKILPEFQEVIDSQANEDDVIKQIAFASLLGHTSGTDFVEGVGSLSKQGITCEEDGIDIDSMELREEE